MAKIEQKPGNLPIEFLKGDSFSATFTFPFDLTNYTIESGITWGENETLFTIIPGTYTASSSTVSIFISEEDSLDIDTELNEWYFKLTLTNTAITYLGGKCKVIQ
jgi:hypothetical protein